MSWQWVTLVLVLALQIELFLLVWFILLNRHTEKMALVETMPMHLSGTPKVGEDTMVHPADAPTVVEPPKAWPHSFTGDDA